MKKVKVLNLKSISDERGNLVPIEACEDIPFEIKRVYYITNVPEGSVRGCHAHKFLKQVLICLNGSVKIRLDNGKEKETFILDNNYTAIYAESLIWCEMFDFTNNTVLLVLASEHYDKLDYIGNYEEFIYLADEV